jgi:vacuolar-type H+-ATPase subunit H
MLSKLKSNPMEQRADREIEKLRDPEKKIIETAKELQKRLQQEKLDDCDKNIQKSSK